MKKDNDIDELVKIYTDLLDWATGNDTGASSCSMLRYLLGMESTDYGYMPPSDASDRGRCIRMLNRFPEWWDRIDGMSGLSLEWKTQIELIKKEANK